MTLIEKIDALYTNGLRTAEVAKAVDMELIEFLQFLEDNDMLEWLTKSMVDIHHLICKGCKKPFVSSRKKEYCGNTCRSRSKPKSKKDKDPRPLHTVKQSSFNRDYNICEYCGEKFYSERTKQKFCDGKCHGQYRKQQRLQTLEKYRKIFVEGAKQKKTLVQIAKELGKDKTYIKRVAKDLGVNTLFHYRGRSQFGIPDELLEKFNKKLKHNGVNFEENLVYFMVINYNKYYLVKIGTTCDLKRLKSRLDSINTSCPLTVNEIYIINGNYKLEQDLHQKFGKCRIMLSKEWFVISPQQLKYIQEYVLNHQSLPDNIKPTSHQYRIIQKV